MHKNRDLGQYVSLQRTARCITCRDLSQMVGISTAYLSQLERGIRLNPDPQLLLRIAKELSLSPEEATILFDLYAETTGNLPPDITEYLNGNSAVQRALRQAREVNATEEDWERFIEQLKK